MLLRPMDRPTYRPTPRGFVECGIMNVAVMSWLLLGDHLAGDENLVQPRSPAAPASTGSN